MAWHPPRVYANRILFACENFNMICVTCNTDLQTLSSCQKYNISEQGGPGRPRVGAVAAAHRSRLSADRRSRRGRRRRRQARRRRVPALSHADGTVAVAVGGGGTVQIRPWDPEDFWSLWAGVCSHIE